MLLESARAVVAVVIATVALAATGCADGGQQQPGDAGVIRLGALFPLSGARKSAGEVATRAAQLAVNDANERGGVLGRRVQLTVGDDACEPATAVSAARTLIARDIVVSVGGACSIASVPTAKIFHDAGISMVIPTSNSSDLLTPGYDTVFLVSGTTDDEARFALDALGRLGVRRLAVIDDKTSYSVAMAATAATLAGRPDSPVALAGHLQLTQGARSYRRTADEVIAAGADAVFYTGYSAEAALLVTDLHAAGYRGTIVLGDGCSDPGTFAEVPAAVSDGVYTVTFPIPQHSTGIADWTEHYRTVYGSAPPPRTMQAYDAVAIALDAIRRAGTTDPAAVRAAIAATNRLPALTGPVRFHPDGSRVEPRFLLLQTRGTVTAPAPHAAPSGGA